MKFEIKQGKEINISVEIIEEKNTSLTPNIVLTICSVIFVTVLILISSSAVYGAKTGDYTIFNSLTQTFNKAIDAVGK